MVELAITAQIRSALTDWISDALRQTVAKDQLNVEAPTAGGWSNDTWFVRFSNASDVRVVVRLEPEQQGMFPDYDLGKQCAVMQALASNDLVPVPKIFATDLQGARLGRPAFLMEYISGRVPSDNPPTFVEAGWLFEATPEQQRVFHENLITCMAAIHKVDLDTRALSGLALETETPPATHELNALQTIWDYDRGPAYPSVVDHSLQVLRDNAPVEAFPVGLVWGDARPANVICEHESFDITALLDWELAGIGVAETEILWLQEMNWVRTEGAGLAPLPGFLSAAESIALYEAKVGRRMNHLDWFAQLAATRVAVFMHRFLRKQVSLRRIDPHHRVLRENVSSRRLADHVRGEAHSNP